MVAAAPMSLLSLNCRLAQVRHPNCIRLWEAYLTERTVFLVMELATGGELLER